MVLAVNYGHKMQKKKVILWMSLTILGGIAFLGSQAWEWGHFIHGERGAINTKTLEIVHIAKDNELSSVYELVGVDAHHAHHEITLDEVIKNLEEKPEYNIRRLANREIISNQASIAFLNKNGTMFLKDQIFTIMNMVINYLQIISSLLQVFTDSTYLVVL